MVYLTQEHIAGLKAHKYSCVSNSPIDLYVMKPYWDWLVTFVPLWVAPNLITMVGLIVNLFTSILLLIYCPTAVGEAPSWVYLGCAIGLFIYQSLDAIDGKQARRTNSSSPLGELFDHGCDSVSMVFLTLAGGAALNIGPSFSYFILALLFNFVFFCAHWQTYVSGTLTFGYVDVTEAQLAVMLVHFISFFFGPTWWNKTLFGFEHNNYLLAISCAGLAFMLFRTFLTIVQHESNRGTVAGTSVVSPAIPPFLLIGFAWMAYSHTTTGLFERHAALFILCFGLSFAKITNQLVVAHMSKTPFPLLDSALLGPCILALGIRFANNLINEDLLLFAVFALNLINLVVYCTTVCREIATALKIKVFSIPPVKAQK